MEHTYKVSGMSCEHCVMRVREALEGLEGVSSVNVELESGTATVVSSAALDEALVASAIDDAGYELVPVAV